MSLTINKYERSLLVFLQLLIEVTGNIVLTFPRCYSWSHYFQANKGLLTSWNRELDSLRKSNILTVLVWEESSSTSTEISKQSMKSMITVHYKFSFQQAWKLIQSFPHETSVQSSVFCDATKAPGIRISLQLGKCVTERVQDRFYE